MINVIWTLLEGSIVASSPTTPRSHNPSKEKRIHKPTIVDSIDPAREQIDSLPPASGTCHADVPSDAAGPPSSHWSNSLLPTRLNHSQVQSPSLSVSRYVLVTVLMWSRRCCHLSISCPGLSLSSNPIPLSTSLCLMLAS